MNKQILAAKGASPLINTVLSEIIFGFENKMINNATGKSGNESYIQNTSNYIAASTKDFFKKERDISTGTKVFVMGIVNLIIYFVLIYTGS